MKKSNYVIETIPKLKHSAVPRIQRPPQPPQPPQPSQPAMPAKLVSEGWGSPEAAQAAAAKSDAELMAARQARDIADAKIPLAELLKFCLYQLKPLLPNLQPMPDYETYRQTIEAEGRVDAMCYFSATRKLVNRAERAKPVVAGVVLDSSAWNVAENEALITITSERLTGRRLGQLSSRGIDAYEALAEIKQAE